MLTRRRCNVTVRMRTARRARASASGPRTRLGSRVPVCDLAGPPRGGGHCRGGTYPRRVTRDGENFKLKAARPPPGGLYQPEPRYHWRRPADAAECHWQCASQGGGRGAPSHWLGLSRTGTQAGSLLVFRSGKARAGLFLGGSLGP